MLRLGVNDGSCNRPYSVTSGSYDAWQQYCLYLLFKTQKGSVCFNKLGVDITSQTYTYFILAHMRGLV